MFAFASGILQDQVPPLTGIGSLYLGTPLHYFLSMIMLYICLIVAKHVSVSISFIIARFVFH